MWIKKQQQQQYVVCKGLKLNIKGIKWLKGKVEKYHVNTNQEKDEGPILASSEVDLRTRKIIRNKQNKNRFHFAGKI